MILNNLTPSQLRQAADLKEKIEELQHELTRLQGDGAPSAAVSVARNGRRGKRVISAAGLAGIRAGQKARWAKVKAAEATPKRRGPRRMSAVARAKIAAAARARWARYHAAKGGK